MFKVKITFSIIGPKHDDSWTEEYNIKTGSGLEWVRRIRSSFFKYIGAAIEKGNNQ